MEKAKIKRTSIVINPEFEAKINYIKSINGTTTSSEVIYQSVHETFTKLRNADLKNKMTIN